MSAQRLEDIQEVKITFKDEFLLEYYRLMSKFAQFKRNLLKKYTASRSTKILQREEFAYAAVHSNSIPKKGK